MALCVVQYVCLRLPYTFVSAVLYISVLDSIKKYICEQLAYILVLCGLKTVQAELLLRVFVVGMLLGTCWIFVRVPLERV